MRANPITIGFLILAASTISACNVPASAQFRSRAPLPTVRRPPVSGIGTEIPVTRSCDRPLDRRGRAINALIQSYDSTSGILTVSTNESPGVAYPFPQPVFQASSCLPIESHDGHRQTLRALVPEKFVVLWVSDLVMPTVPPQFILMGIEVFDSLPTNQ